MATKWFKTTKRETWEEREAREANEARERWVAINKQARLAGCMCGAEATHVRRYGGTIGGVPSEVWTCEEHQNVNRWGQVGDGPWIPQEDTTFEIEAWRIG